jgi:hypothetical protein
MIMATDTKLDSLVINYLSQAQYDNAKREGTLHRPPPVPILPLPVQPWVV